MRLLIFLALAVIAAGATSAERLFKDGQKAEKTGQVVQAYLLYSQASALEPTNLQYQAGKERLRPLAALSSDKRLPDAANPEAAPPGQSPTEKSNVTRITGTLTEQDLDKLRRMLPPPTLKPTPGIRSFQLRADPKSLYEQVASAYGLIAIMDRDFNPTVPVRFELKDADYRTALHALEMITSSFVVPLSERVLLVAQDSTQKRNDLETDAAAIIPIPWRTSVQEAQEIAVAIQQTLEIRRLMLDPQKRVIAIRDRASKVAAARQMLADLDGGRATVAIEVEFISIADSSSLNFGMRLPTSFPLVNFGSVLRSSPSIPAGFARFLTFGAGKTFLGIGITSAELFATASRASASTLMKADLTGNDSQPINFHVGDKYPIATTQYIGTGSGSSQAFTPPPPINFEDLGVVLKITPVIHSLEEVSLDIDAEFKVLGVGNYNGIPVITTRKFQSKVRLRNSEWAIVAGLVSDQNSRSWTGIPGLAEIPAVGKLLRENSKSRDGSQVLLVIKPHVTSFPPGEIVTHPFWVGSETRPLTTL